MAGSAVGLILLCGLVIGLRACAVWRPETRWRTAFAAGSELALGDLLGQRVAGRGGAGVRGGG
ncbi:MAG TPA: hypothetical protein VG756_16195 [Pseudonocardiaceae bacterium]|nr:hypothetical protein [Pseudonocardiaceae bacterium]